MNDTVLRGSCLCGAVRYEIGGQPSKFYHCHCKRCRKATGTGHASNLLVQTGSIDWLQGEQHVRYYKVPEAQRFANCFCGVCGARLPRYVKETGFIVIPAGSLDSEPSIRPQARIFWGSRASWSCGGEELPVHQEYES
ncbi:aldehyde-activating protein [Sulfurifustis variabilis]|uniref:Aldehyde-activating protein n=1 Tax=Sulfurifustis variabilis TaxID=1675686 RepID=A0A1B4VB81_9GAMM|nr:GFA family protein [Sulfurifustis variabilis]BAU49364.1 aldehyde-activating protein [Sulfurifustis variabilis]